MYVLFTVLISIASAQSPYQTIYGEDDRQDLFEISSQKTIEASKAIAALIYAPKLTVDGPIALLDLKPYGKRFGLCKGVRFAEQPSGPFATGFLVGPKLVLTAGHAVMNEAKEQFADELLCNEVKLVFGYALQNPKQNLSSVKSEQVFSCKMVLKRKIRWMNEDYALIELDREVKGVRPLQFEYADQIKPGTPVMTIGHPHGLPMKFSDNALIRGLDGQRFSMNTDTSGGNSGSPIFNAMTMKVLGIHVSGELDFDKSRGCKRPYKCKDNSCWGSWGYRPPQSFLDSLPQYLSKN